MQLTLNRRKTEEHINSFPNYTASIPDSSGKEFSVHFIALFSTSSTATPLLLMHGWPGSFLEFLPMLSLLKQKYPANELPYHVIVPSLPGYGLSEGTNTERQWSMSEGALMLDKLMVGLGLSGYVAQGGDIGSYFARILAVESEHCKAVHREYLSAYGVELVANNGSQLQSHDETRRQLNIRSHRCRRERTRTHEQLQLFRLFIRP